MEARYGKFLDMIRAVRISVPLIEVLAGMPNYGKIDLRTHHLESTSPADFVILRNAKMIANVPLILGDHFHTADVFFELNETTQFGVRTEQDDIHIDSAMNTSYFEQ
ncbi:hypothetical protein Tco_0884256 [Tanacetum coccineum]